jgi:Tol biopolymer transport system component
VLSANGRAVAFSSNASDLVPNDTNGVSDVFVRDLTAETTTLVSVNSSGTAGGDGGSVQLRLSANGQFVAFQSYASDLVANDTNGASDVFVRDLAAGITTLASINDAGTGSGNSGSFDPRISADGRFVAFVSIASDLVPNDTNNTSDIFVRDAVTGATALVSVNAAGTASGNGGSFELQISADGRFVAFSSIASDLVPNDTNGAADIFVRDLIAGTTTLASVDSSATVSGNGGSSHPRISADGRFVAFDSTASDLVANDTNGTTDVFVRDLMTGTTTLASRNSASGTSGNNQSLLPTDSVSQVVSPDGRFIAFEGDASDLVLHDANDARDVFRFQLR